ncbi:sigma-54 dependent transcriptional regulator [Anaerosalibacter bizertensis]|uniref:sigma-54-dependent transcriptional regulator n=1 Tax=Anaerosalibacter bizertensis TaxID=932217 RepID=UPI001C0E9CCF|nr:sigma-54 dependent transcriptional regulator [Anaerosalibacter bizertensis]
MKILIIDDEKSIRFSLKMSLESIGMEVYSAETGEEGIKLFKLHLPELAIVDIKLPGIDGIEVLKEIKKINNNCLVIMITYLSEVRLAVKAMKIGAYDYFTKPFTLKDINKAIEDAKKYIETKKKLNKLSYETKLIGESEEIKNIKKNIDKISKTKINTCILIEGESGTGKEVVAKLIHEGMGKDKPFIALNCAAIPKNIQESELFGYEKGAFTGADKNKLGLMGKANKGILFLDEIGDMDLTLQAKLLRVLQEKKYRPVGSLEEMDFDATIISATNKKLKEQISKGNFREDLYYRLNVIPLEIPPLRDRKDDIPILLYSFLNEYNKKLGKNIVKIDDNAMEIMKEYNWPGNVRELKNIVERIAIFSEGEVIYTEDLPRELIEDVDIKLEKLSPLEISEKDIIISSLKENNWNISKTSRDLDISRSTLRRKIEKYNL